MKRGLIGLIAGGLSAEYGDILPENKAKENQQESHVNKIDKLNWYENAAETAIS